MEICSCFKPTNKKPAPTSTAEHRPGEGIQNSGGGSSGPPRILKKNTDKMMSNVRLSSITEENVVDHQLN